MEVTGKKQIRDYTLDLMIVAAMLAIIIGLIFRQIQVLLPVASLLLAMRIHLSTPDANLRRITGVLSLFFGASFLSSAAWYVLPNVVDYNFLTSDAYKIGSGMFWFAGYVAVAYALVKLKNSKQWYIERGLDRLITAGGVLVFFAIAMYTFLNMPLEDGHSADLLFPAAYLGADVIGLWFASQLTRTKRRWLKYLAYAGLAFFAINALIALDLFIGLPFINYRAIDIFILLAYLCTDVIILMMALKLTQMKLPWEVKYLIYAVLIYFAINSIGDLLYETRFLFHLKYLLSLTMGGFQLELLTQDATDIIYNLSLLIVSSLLFFYAPISFLNPVRDDIRKRLSDTQLFVDDLIAKSPDATCIFDRDGRLALVNDAFLNIYGLPRETLTRGKINIFGHVDSRVFQKDVYQKLLDVRKGETVILPKVKMPGLRGGRQEDFYIYVKMFPTYGSDGQIANYVLIVEDITERTLAEEALKASERRNAALLDAIPDMMFVLTPEGDYVDYKVHDWSVLPVPPDQIVGKNIRDIGFDKAMIPVILRHLKQAVDTRQLQQFEYELGVPAGWRSFEARLIALTDREVLTIVRDITERKQSAEALRASEARFRALFENAGAAIFLIDTDNGKIVDSNSNGELLIGRPRDELRQMNVTQLHPPDDVGKHRDSFIGQAALGHVVNYEAEVVRGDGRRIPVMVNATPMVVDGRKIMMGFFLDITERKLAEEALRESEEKFRALADSSQAGIILVQGEAVVYVNQALAVIGGYTVEECLGKNYLEFIHPDFRELLRERGSSAQSDGKIVKTRYEVKIIRKNGETRWLDVSPSIMKYNGMPAIIITAIDINDRKQFEEALRESEQKFKALAETAPVAICILQDGRFRYANPAMETITGYDKAELPAVNFLDLVYPDNREYFVGRYADWLRGDIRGELRSQFKGVQKGGMVRWADLSLKPIEYEGRPALLLTGIDITERMQAEEALRESEQKFKALTETAPVAICILQDGRFQYANSAMVAITGYEKEELLAIDFIDVVHPGYRKYVGGLYDEWLGGDTGGESRTVIMGVRKDGTESWIDLSWKTIDYAGRPALLLTGMDITERKRAEQALVESVERLRLSAATARFGTFEWDVVNDRHVWSPETYDIYGVPPGTTVTIALLKSLIYPGDEQDDVVRAALEPAGPGGYAMEYRIRRGSDGGVRWVYMKTRVFFEGEGAERRAVRIVGAVQDITERKQAEQALVESEEKFRVLAETSPAAICVFRDERFIYANPAVERVTGYSREELLMMEIWDLMAPGARESLRGEFTARMGESQMPFRYELKLVNKGGEDRWVDLSVGPVIIGGAPAYIVSAFDTTERKRAEQSLIESEQKFKALTETAPVAICILQDGRFKYANPATETITGYGRAELLSNDFMSLVHPDSREYITRIYTPWLNGDDSGEPRYVITSLRKDGKARWVDLSWKTIDFEGRRALLLTGVDITDRKQAEQSLIESEQKFKALTEMAPVAISILQDGKFRYANPAMEAISGYSREELLSSVNFMDMVHPDAWPYIVDNYNKWLSGESSEARSRLKGIRKNGTMCWIDLSRKTIDYEGRLALLLTGIDITERVRAEEALRESEEKFRQLAETSPVAIVIYQDEKILYVNPAAEMITGYTSTELLMMSPREIIHPDYSQLYEEMMALRTQGMAHSKRYDIRIVTRDGQERWVSTSGATIMHRDRPAGLSVIIDITERKRAEVAQKLEEKRLQALMDLNEMVGTPDADISRFALDRAIELTGSQFGFIKSIGDAPTGQIFSFSNNAIKSTGPHVPGDIPLGRGGLWTESLQTLKPLIVNDYAKPRESKIGLPEWHSPIGRLLIVPVVEDNRAVLVAAVANKATDYDESDARQVSLLINGMYRVISRARAEEALRESEEKFRQLAETSPAVIVIYEGEHNLYINPAGERLTGYTLDEFLKMKSWELMHPDYHEFVREKTALRMRGVPLSEHYDVRVVTKYGEERWASISTAPITYGKKPAVLILAIDITDRKEAEEALRESEASLAMAQTIAHIGNWEWDIEKNKYYWSDEFYNVFGLDRQYDPDYDTFFGMVHPGDRARVERALYGALYEGKPLNLDSRVVRPDGTERTVHCEGEAFRDKNGRPIKMYGIIQDITERKRAEETLRESEASLARAQTMAHIGNWEWDVAGKMSRWSDELYHIYGLDRRQFSPDFGNFLSMVHPGDRHHIEDSINGALREGKPYNVDFRVVRPDGTERTIHSEAEVVYDGEGRPVKLFGTSQDITERVRLEHELYNAYNSLREMYERKIDFTNAAAHELRTPLTPIIGYTDILKAEVTSERHRKFLEIIERNALRQKAMVNSLLELASLDAGMMQVRKSEFALLPMASEVADNYRTINPHITIDVVPFQRINTDPDILRHVLDNLVSNAVKYSDHESEIVIRAADAGKYYQFSVKDCGQGIPREEWGRIFERFYLVGGDRDNRTSGRIGLGLALVKAYVNLLGGEVWLDSEPGQGSTFYFTVPRTP